MEAHYKPCSGGRGRSLTWQLPQTKLSLAFGFGLLLVSLLPALSVLLWNEDSMVHVGNSELEPCTSFGPGPTP